MPYNFFKKQFPIYIQVDRNNCGPSCVRMVAAYYGFYESSQYFMDVCNYTKHGTSMADLCHAAHLLGFDAEAVQFKYEGLPSMQMPCILFINDEHYIILLSIEKNRFEIVDPLHGKMRLNEQDFYSYINGRSPEYAKEKLGYAILLAPNEQFESKSKINSYQIPAFIRSFIMQVRWPLIISLAVLIATSLLDLTLPFINKHLIDSGILKRDEQLIILLIIFQTSVHLSSILLNTIRSWIQLKISNKFNIFVMRRFFENLISKNFKFFDFMNIGDAFQRIYDHQRIEDLLVGSGMNTLVSVFQILIMGSALFFLDKTVFGIFITGNLIYILWTVSLLKKRQVIDNERFTAQSEVQNTIVEMLSGIRDIKLNNIAEQTLMKWEKTQKKSIQNSIKSWKLESFQSIGTSFIIIVTTTIISLMTAYSVIDYTMTIGTMFSISAILGQLTYPIQQIILFIFSWQDASLAYTRINEINSNYLKETNLIKGKPLVKIEFDKLYFRNVSFSYSTPRAKVLRGVNLDIKRGDFLAVVGESGSGKSTLSKLIARIYEPLEGKVFLDQEILTNYKLNDWRNHISFISPDSFIFDDTVLKNIVLSETNVDYDKLDKVLKDAMFYEIAMNLPKKMNTKLSMFAPELSNGQKQRLLIARALYKTHQILILDEATNGLDALSEQMIYANIRKYDTTLIVIAHRLNTIQHADKIIVMGGGQVIESGTHQELMSAKKSYYHLVENQINVL